MVFPFVSWKEPFLLTRRLGMYSSRSGPSSSKSISNASEVDSGILGSNLSRRLSSSPRNTG